MILTMALALAATGDDADLLATYRARTAAVVRCERTVSGDEILICGRRAADRYRVPLVVVTPGDRSTEGVVAERTRLMHRTTPVQDLSPFLVGGGLAGVRMTRTFGPGIGSGDTQVVGLRPLAP